MPFVQLSGAAARGLHRARHRLRRGAQGLRHLPCHRPHALAELGGVFCIPAFASLARVPFRVLAPAIILLCVAGTYSVNGSIVEVGIMLACGVLGFFMRRYGMSPAALVIALVLGPLAEETLRQTMIISGGDFTIFLQRTTSLVLLVVIAALVLLPALLPRIRRAVAARLAALARRRSAGLREPVGADSPGDPG